MNRYLLVTILLALAHTASADQLDGLEFLDTMLILILIGGISILVLGVSSMAAIIHLMVEKEWKGNIGMNLSCWTLNLCSFFSIITLDSHIDTGFLATCIGIIVLCSLLLILNYITGTRPKDKDAEENK